MFNTINLTSQQTKEQTQSVVDKSKKHIRLTAPPLKKLAMIVIALACPILCVGASECNISKDSQTVDLASVQCADITHVIPDLNQWVMDYLTQANSSELEYSHHNVIDVIQEIEKFEEASDLKSEEMLRLETLKQECLSKYPQLNLNQYYQKHKLPIFKIEPDSLSNSDAWRVLKIASEITEGFDRLNSLGPSVSIFGSARISPAHPYYTLAQKVAKAITRKGFAVMTGGGPGIMAAANRGAQAAKGPSVGIGINLPFETSLNPFIDPKFALTFRFFFVRKLMLIRYAQAYVFLPGGLGTMDELFEALTLIQTRKIHPFPIFLLGKQFWEGMTGWMKDQMLTNGLIKESDLQHFHITDDPQEVANRIEAHYLSYHLQKNI